jgi:hypothetical protein
MYLTRKRAELLTHVQNTNSQYNLTLTDFYSVQATRSRSNSSSTG